MFHTIILWLLTCMVINSDGQFQTFSYEFVIELLTTIPIPYNKLVRHFNCSANTSSCQPFYHNCKVQFVD